MPLNRNRNRLTLLAVAVAISAVLSACGGGSSGCSTQQTLSITGTAYPTADIKLKLGVAMRPLTPVLAGIPESCQGDKRFEMSGLLSPIPKGLVIDVRTGTISGTPTGLTPTTTSSGIRLSIPSSVTVVLQLPGYSAVQLGTVSFVVTED